jgi:hypothetical protein
MSYNTEKVDHNGAKNGGGAYDTREVAKKESSKRRRVISRREAEAGAEEKDPAPRPHR